MADVLNAAEIASIESDLQAWYPHTCNIIRHSVTGADVYGGETHGTTTVATGVKCDMTPQVQRLRAEEVLAARVESRQIYDVSLPPGTDVKIHDHLLITSVTPNKDMVVMAVLTPESWEFERMAVCSLEGEPIV